MPSIPENTDRAAVDEFWLACSKALPHLNLPTKKFALRCIGTTQEMNSTILGLIASGQKVGTFPLPRQLERMGEPLPKPGDFTIQLTLGGKPKLLVQTTSAEIIPFRAITAEHTAIDGPTVRALDVWRKVHIPYYTNILAAFGETFTEDISTCVERFTCLYVAP